MFQVIFVLFIGMRGGLFLRQVLCIGYGFIFGVLFGGKFIFYIVDCEFFQVLLFLIVNGIFVQLVFCEGKISYWFIGGCWICCGFFVKMFEVVGGSLFG